MEQSSNIIDFDTLIMICGMLGIVVICIIYILYHAHLDSERSLEFVYNEMRRGCESFSCDMDSPRALAMEKFLCEDFGIDYKKYQKYKSRKSLTKGQAGEEQV